MRGESCKQFTGCSKAQYETSEMEHAAQESTHGHQVHLLDHYHNTTHHH
jgi:hypothetical protein